MVIRISAAEAARLGVKSPKKKRKSKSTRPAIKDETFSGQDPICLKLPVHPYTKDRPRSFIDERSLVKAFQIAKGSIDVFKKHIRMKTITQKETRDFEKAVANAARAMMGNKPPLEGPVEIYVRFVLNGDKDYWAVSRRDGDLDNHEKSLFDALNGIVYSDDCVIVDKHTQKVFGGEGAGEIIVFAAPANLATFADPDQVRKKYGA